MGSQEESRIGCLESMWRVRGDQFAIFTFQFVYSSAPSRSLLCHPASLVANERVKDDVVEFFSLNDAVRKFYEQFWKHCFVVEVRSGKGALEESDFQLQFGFPFLLLMLLLLLFVLFEE